MGIKSLRIFFSYSTADKEYVAELKNHLELYGFDVFLAHEDIKPCVEWQEEIQKNLDMADIFVAVLTVNFKESDWTDQETGIAIAGQKFIIPIQIDMVPYGFINKFQSLKIKKNVSNHAEVTAGDIIDAIIERSKFKDDVKAFFINALAESRSWEAGKKRAKTICLKFTSFTKDEIRTIYEIAIENNQVYGAFGAQSTLTNFFNKHRDSLSDEELKKVLKILS